jgi:hypothetical protein
MPVRCSASHGTLHHRERGDLEPGQRRGAARQDEDRLAVDHARLARRAPGRKSARSASRHRPPAATIRAACWSSGTGAVKVPPKAPLAVWVQTMTSTWLRPSIARGA